MALKRIVLRLKKQYSLKDLRKFEDYVEKNSLNPLSAWTFLEQATLKDAGKSRFWFFPSIDDYIKRYESLRVFGGREIYFHARSKEKEEEGRMLSFLEEFYSRSEILRYLGETQKAGITRKYSLFYLIQNRGGEINSLLRHLIFKKDSRG